MPVVGLFVDSSPLSCVSRVCEIHKLNRRSSVSPLFLGTKKIRIEEIAPLLLQIFICFASLLPPSASYHGVSHPEFWVVFRAGATGSMQWGFGAWVLASVQSRLIAAFLI